jgi:phosphoribosylanthranilate isomerase
MYKIKICGITTVDDALLAAEAGADAIGLNFYDKSPRYVDAARAAEIVERLREDYAPDQLQVFAVFVNASLDDILWTLRDADLYGIEQGVGIQLHGDEPPELLRDLCQQGLGQDKSLLQALGYVPVVPLVRAFRCPSTDLSAPAAYLQQCQRLGVLPQGVLLDAFSPDSYGGTGDVMDWSVISRERNKLLGLPVVLAGGLTPANVATAIAAAKPDAVDVASGVESAPGTKDAAKVYAFIAGAKKALDFGRQGK